MFLPSSRRISFCLYNFALLTPHQVSRQSVNYLRVREDCRLQVSVSKESISVFFWEAFPLISLQNSRGHCQTKGLNPCQYFLDHFTICQRQACLCVDAGVRIQLGIIKKETETHSGDGHLSSHRPAAFSCSSTGAKLQSPAQPETGWQKACASRQEEPSALHQNKTSSSSSLSQPFSALHITAVSGESVTVWFRRPYRAVFFCLSELYLSFVFFLFIVTFSLSLSRFSYYSTIVKWNTFQKRYLRKKNILGVF